MTERPRETPTEAMRLRPRATVAGAQVPTREQLEQRDEPPPLVEEPAPGEATRVQLIERLAAVRELHRPGIVVGWCVECLLPHPCSTWLLAAGHAPTPTPPEDESQ